MSRLLYVIGASTFGGGTRHVADLAGAAGTAGHEVLVLTTDARTREYFGGLGIETISEPVLPRNREVYRATAAARDLAAVIRRVGADVVHSHTTVAGIVTRLACGPSRNVRVLHTVHGLPFGARDGLRAAPAVLLEYGLRRRSDDLICVNHNDWVLLRRFGLAPTLIQNGVDVPEEERAVGDDSTRIAYVGRLAPQKGVDVLVRAMASLPGVRLDVYGEGPRLTELQRLADEIGVAGRIRWHGFEPDPWARVATVDVVAVPSRFEGHSMVVLEAMARGHVVVGTDIPGVTESLAGSGILVPPDRSDQLAAGLRRALGMNPKERAELAARSRETIRARFSRAAMLRAYLEVLDA
jgi:glycosyltransferase involved in cell wall biosynthesis